MDALKRCSLLQEHDVAGVANDARLTIVLCRNCHAVAQAQLKDAGVDITHRSQRNLLEVIVAVLKGAGLTMIEWGKRFVDWAERLAAGIAELDEACPGWRELGAMQL